MPVTMSASFCEGSARWTPMGHSELLHTFNESLKCSLTEKRLCDKFRMPRETGKAGLLGGRLIHPKGYHEAWRVAALHVD